MKIEIAPNQASIINRIAQLMISHKVGFRYLSELCSLKRTLCVARFKEFREHRYSASQRKLVTYYGIKLVSRYRANAGTDTDPDSRKLMWFGTYSITVYNKLINTIYQMTNNLYKQQ